MELIEEEIRRLTPTIWDTILHLPLEVAGESALPGNRMLSACVHITGAWNGAVSLSCEVDFASEAAAIMFGLVGSDPTTADMQDALGELTNMVGGNIKALLPEPCHLSLPAVVEGADYSMRIPRSRLVTRIPFRSGEHALHISLLQREEKAA
jgi:chemotaxis protein CheX